MAFIVAVQSSFFTDDKLEVKEIAVVGLQKQSISHWIVSPSCDFSKLSKIARQHSTNNTMREHHLCWTDGQSSIKKVEECIREITRGGDIYVDGDRAERQYIENIVGKNIMSLEKTRMPSFNRLKMNNVVSLCGLHCAREEKDVNCALQRALLAQVWILSLAPTELRNPEILNILARGKGKINNEGKFICYDEVDYVGVRL